MAFSPQISPPERFEARSYPRVTLVLYSSGMVDKLGRRRGTTPTLSGIGGMDAAGRKRQPDWAIIRAEYEGRLYVPPMICQRHGITPAQLRYRREKEDWLSLKAHPPSRMQLVVRMLRVLDAQMRELETDMELPIDKKAAMLAGQVKTLDKLIEMGAAQRNVEPPTRKDMTDLRAKLVKRLEQSER